MLPAAAPPAAPGPHASALAIWPADRLAAAIRRDVEAGAAPASVADFYRAHGYRPLWIERGRLRPEAWRVGPMLEAAADDGLDPAAYGPERLAGVLSATQGGGARELAHAELALSAAYAAYVSDLHRPPPSAQMAFWDRALPAPPATPRRALELLAASRAGLVEGLAAARRMHPIYERLRAELAISRASGADPADQALILANMARARALPGDPGRRYILVDPAAQQIWLYENGRVADTMRAIVGAPRAQTPSLAGLMRYARYRPYWNIPPDIVRDEIAPQVLREGVAYVERAELEILSDWTPQARVLDPAEVDWNAVASGAVTLRVRRLPGADNILGQVKLMLPNPLGIYLHDTPNKGPFGWDRRLLSHGCVRLEDAQRLARRLIGPAADDPPPGDDVRVDLAEPVPVYIVYLTLAPVAGRLERRADVYGRDAPLIAEIGAAGAG